MRINWKGGADGGRNGLVVNVAEPWKPLPWALPRRVSVSSVCGTWSCGYRTPMRPRTCSKRRRIVRLRV